MAEDRDHPREEKSLSRRDLPIEARVKYPHELQAEKLLEKRAS